MCAMFLHSKYYFYNRYTLLAHGTNIPFSDNQLCNGLIGISPLGTDSWILYNVFRFFYAKITIVREHIAWLFDCFVIIRHNLAYAIYLANPLFKRYAVSLLPSVLNSVGYDAIVPSQYCCSTIELCWPMLESFLQATIALLDHQSSVICYFHFANHSSCILFQYQW